MTMRRWNNFVLASAIAVLFFAVAGTSAKAQEGAPSEPAPESSMTPKNSPQQNDQGKKNEAHRQESPGRQLVHTSNEAAGEEKDETAEFKQSSSVQFVARLTRMSLQRAYQLCVFLNFAVIGVVILWASKKYLPGMFRARTASIQKAMQEAQKASEEARKKLAEIETRLSKLDAEIAAMRNSAEKEAAAEEARIKAAAEEDARKIVAGAEQEIAAAAKAARRALAVHAADLAVALAQKQIHVDTATDQALVRGFAGQLNASDGGKDKN
jgi:F-type H+-transporting ATPase subunit b